MKQTLEKIVNKVKEVSRKSLKFVKENAEVGIMFSGLVFGGFFVDENMSKVYAGNLRIKNHSSLKSGTYVYNGHGLGATENYDNGKDSEYLNGPNKLQIYSKNLNCLPFTDKLSRDVRGINSTTTFSHELYSNGFSGTADNSLKFKIVDNNDLEWKNIFLGGANDSNNIVADIKYVVVNGVNGEGTYNLPTLTGNPPRIYDKRKVMPKNHADLNRDKKVDNKDFAIFGGNWGRTGIVKGSDVNDLGAYADIQDAYDANGVMTSYGDGVVDYEDLGLFVGEWLWDANDANTWSKATSTTFIPKYLMDKEPVYARMKATDRILHRNRKLSNAKHKEAA